MKGGFFMNALEAIFSRKSIRRYTEQDITVDKIEILLRAAMSAPSAIDNKDWAFVVVRDKEILNNIRNNQDGNGEMLQQASVAIVVCGDMTLAHGEYWIQDCSAAAENILIAATSLGIGSVWLGTYPRMHRVEGLRKILNIPDHIIPMAIIALGYPDEKKPKVDRFDPNKVHYNKW